MEQSSKTGSGHEQEQVDPKGPLVFLDTSVILAFLQGDSSAAELFSAESQGRIRFAVNPIVLQELLLTADLAGEPEFGRIREHLRVLPVDFSKAEALIPAIRDLRNRIVHSNDVLILSSAYECDFLVTKDSLLEKVASTGKPKILTPEEFATHLRAA
ncbi:MAG TPA: PIN domain-containing protein [Bryobacteraceae bacterium]|nr:PIN domain-containing protein [Bryobacteraceae bacterium]